MSYQIGTALNLGIVGAAAQGTIAPADVDSPFALTPDALLAYCSSRLNSIDTVIKESFQTQESKNKDIADASALIKVLHGFPDGHCGSDDIKSAENLQQAHADMGNSLVNEWKSTSSPEVKAACEKAFRNATGLTISDFADKPVTAADIKASAEAGQIPACPKETWDAMISEVKDMQTDMSKSSELNMITLQSLVAQRQLAVQLTTQLMQNVNETAKSAVSNIGRS